MSHIPLPNKKGFTLVEILVATTIMVIALASIYMSFEGGMASWTKGTARMERYLNARAALDMMSREIRAAMIAASGIYEIDFVGGDDGVNSYLNFVAPVRGDVTASDLLKVRYQLNVNNRELERTTDDSIDGNIMGGFYPPPPSPITENTISLNFRYWDATAPTPAWRNYWDSRTVLEGGAVPDTVDELPAAVEITIQIQDELGHEIEQEFSTIVYLPLSR